MEFSPRLRPALAAIFSAALVLVGAYSARTLSAQNAPPADPGTLALESPPERLPSGGWRLRWSSTPGRLYKLQRWTSADLGQPATPAWSDIAMVRASAATAAAEDPSAVAAPRGFYRVQLVEETAGTDSEPPVILILNKQGSVIHYARRHEGNAAGSRRAIPRSRIHML